MSEAFNLLLTEPSWLQTPVMQPPPHPLVNNPRDHIPARCRRRAACTSLRSTTSPACIARRPRSRPGSRSSSLPACATRLWQAAWAQPRSMRRCASRCSAALAYPCSRLHSESWHADDILSGGLSSVVACHRWWTVISGTGLAEVGRVSEWVSHKRSTSCLTWCLVKYITWGLRHKPQCGSGREKNPRMCWPAFWCVRCT